MGKKSKKTKTTADGSEAALAPTTADAPKENVGLSEKSKKIKKKKKDKPLAVPLEKVAESAEVQVTKPKKKKKNKDKKVKTTEEGQKVAAPEEVVGNGKSDGEKHKKKKKKKDKNASKPEKSPKPKAIAVDNDVVTSESESEGDEDDESAAMDKANQSILGQDVNAGEDSSDEDDDAKGKTADAGKEETAKKSTRIQGPEHSVFVGNLPTTLKKGAIKKLFMPFGKILTIRFRTSDGVSLYKKKDRKEAKALICYVRFETKAEAQAACAMNGQTVEGNRIRVSMQTQKHLGHIASTVFVGNIHRKTTDNELYDFFSPVGEIEYVRQISDKGIGYVCFKKGVSIAKALKLNQQQLNGRPLRISKVDPNLQHKRKNKKGNLVDKRRPLPGSAATGAAKRVAYKAKQQEKGQSGEFHGEVAKKQSGKKQKLFKKGGADWKKKVLARKLTAAGGGQKNRGAQ